MSKTGYECTAYFLGIDGKGTCDDECQWWNKKGGCPCAKGHKSWDGKNLNKNWRDCKDSTKDWRE